MIQKFKMRKGITLLLSLLFLMSFAPVFSSALVNVSVTGKIEGGFQYYHGHLVRFILRDNGWPNVRRYIVIRPYTHIFHKGHPKEHLSASVLHPGEIVRCQGGLTTFLNRVVANQIILLSR